MDIKIKYFYGAHKLELNPNGDWIDLYTNEDVWLEEGDYFYVSLGVAMELPEGYEAIIAPRSSTFKNWGLLQANSIGVVDNSFNGPDDEWKLPVYSTREVHIPKDTRLCQFRIIKNQPKLNFIESDLLKNDNRSGFGSTGL